ncbi:MAG: hypothetical protein GFH27_549357n1 [Chloroflexi bacterium AL-W]|nr:hypothetical protein [Chloroflexi bacterium AL-N1]NOK70638.1 hypothetical protein [Chloroflexi bacterium AL-N10]NOK78457.1 hypothetical protein [Chloroflexi bacterium AL-N5]NOK85541.1 hypothetical protein [Chloroflexi bacterium AL-W]NOK92455.1 hypothetical protein [Chloroflexi bacterium AL-N15]
MVAQSFSFPRMSHLAIFVLITLILMVNIPIPSHVVQAQTSDYTVEWGDPGLAITTGSRAIFPSLAFDNNNNAHIVFVDEDGRFFYINNIGGSFSAPQQIDSADGTDRNPFFSLAISGSTLHFVYSLVREDFQIYYRQATINGATPAWSDRQRISELSGDRKAFAPELVVDEGGNAHITWIDDSCGDEYNVFYRLRAANGTLSGISAPRGICDEFQNRPQITLTGNGTPHIAFQAGTDIYYARLEGSSWVGRNVSESSFNSSNGTIATDGTAIYVAWGEGIASGNHDIRFRRSQDGGQNWSNIIALADSPQFSQFPDATWSPTTQRVYITWQDNTGGNLDIWYSEFDPATDITTQARQLINLNGDSTLPSIGVSANTAGIAWQDRVGGEPTIYYLSGQMEGGCSGTLELEGGAEATNKTELSGVVTPQGCAPDQMQISVDEPPDSDTPRVPYASNITVPITDASCESTTVYVQLFEDGSTGTAASDSITVDNSVTAQVRVSNPYSSNLPPTYTPPTLADVALQQGGFVGATDGSDGYTRDRLIYLGINDTGDCSGLARFSVPESIDSAISNGGFQSAIPLPGEGSIGMREFHVIVTDEANNESIFPSADTKFQIIYDPADTDPSPTVTDTLGLPILADGGTVAGDTVNSIIRTFTFDGINVTDNLYGQNGENLGPGQQFWGVWMANSRVDNDQDNPEMEWTAVRVPTPGVSFSVEWNIFTGLGYGPDLTQTGDYFIYIRFLDGAGNPSEGFLKTQVRLEPGYTVPTVHLPAIQR